MVCFSFADCFKSQTRQAKFYFSGHRAANDFVSPAIARGRMGFHLETHLRRLIMFDFFLGISGAPPEPLLMHKRRMRRIDQGRSRPHHKARQPGL